MMGRQFPFAAILAVENQRLNLNSICSCSCRRNLSSHSSSRVIGTRRNIFKFESDGHQWEEKYMDYANDLLNDFSDDDSSQNGDQDTNNFIEEIERSEQLSGTTDGPDTGKDNRNENGALPQSSGDAATTSDLISSLDVQQVSEISSVQSTLRKAEETINKIGSDNDFDYRQLIELNKFASHIRDQILVVHKHIKTRYKSRFPELDTIIKDPLSFTKTILVLGNDFTNADSKASELKKFLKGEQVLIITMSLLEVNSKPLSDEAMLNLTKSCEVLISLHEYRDKIVKYVSSRLYKYAPNLTELLGSDVAVELMAYCGGLQELAITPSCNIPSIGSTMHDNLGLSKVGEAKKGFLNNCKLVEDCPDDQKKKAMRLVAGKVTLAARIDYSKSYIDGAFGRKAYKEIQQKIEKMLEPPENVATKALPIPVDKVSKRRGGRRIRKLKQKYELTELQKAQNRVQLDGKTSSSNVDYFL